MPRTPSNNTLVPLLNKLSQKLGEQQAKNELRWMVDHVHAAMDEARQQQIAQSERAAHRAARLWRNQPARSAAEIERESVRFSSVQWAWLRQAVFDRTESHKPLQYILGNQPFGQANISLRPPVLIPRWETEEWMLRLAGMLNIHAEASSAKEVGQRPLNILDACTGSGCIALGLACGLAPGLATITGVDISNEAIALAEENLALNSMLIKNKAGFFNLDLQAPVAAPRLRDIASSWDIIVSNPPYVTPSEYSELDPDVKEWEDIRALVPLPADADPCKVQLRELDPSGVSFIVQLAKLAQELGVADSQNTSLAGTALPRLVVEIGGEKQVEPVCQAMHDHGFNSTEVWKDMAGVDRVVLGYIKV
ncbi:hypothetical protein LPJ66_007839 [Kickxella alabastrina]|uniref:Uncharacterized protein n=1 Tax=Kickxella alabastrina TaxID=61397 RepID=A0ACC1I8A3_9FUNG|nr:hypothetical protein LPJ66_007839 [Kickxella alabastrina]